MLDFNGVLTIVRAAVNGGRPDLIEDALFERLSVSDLRAKIEAERPAPPTPAAQPAASAALANSGSIFGGPTPAERDRLTEVLAQRFKAVYGKPAG